MKKKRSKGAMNRAPTGKPARRERFAQLMNVSRPMVANLIRNGVLTPRATVGQWLFEYARHMEKMTQAPPARRKNS